MIRNFNILCFFVDGFWIFLKEKVGIGWVLYNGEVKIILEGKVVIELINFLLIVEVEVLRLVMI